MLSRETYDNVYYTHQGWLTEDQSHLFLDDELEKSNGPVPNTRSLIWDVRSLRNPVYHDPYYSEFTVIDHNMYVLGDFIYQSDCCSGLQILCIDSSSEHPVLERVGFFDNKVEIHRVDPDFRSTLIVSNRDSQSNCWVNCKIMGQPCEFQVYDHLEPPRPA